jgi:hypothetical protein
VPETAVMQPIQDLLAYVTKRRVSQIVSESNSLSKIFVEIQRASYSSSYLGHFQSMSKPGDIVVTQRSNKNLCLVLQPTKCLGINDTVTVTLETGPYGAWLFPPEPTATGLALSGVRRKGFFSLLCLFTYTGLANHGITATLQVKTKSLIYRTGTLTASRIFF